MKRILPEEKMSWQRPVLSITNEGIATKGNRYIVGETPTGIFSGLTTDNIAWYDGIQWQEDIPEEGWVLYDANQTELLIYMNGPSGDYWYYFKDIFGTGTGAGLVGTKEVDETNIADTKILEYDSTSDKLVYVAKPTGGGTGFFNKLDATTNPTITDDSVDGYEVGSLWFNVTASKVFQCLNATTGAAVWVELTGSGGGGITYSEVVSAADLTSLTPSDGDIALLTGTKIYVIYLNSAWHSLGWLPNVTTGNLFGELIHYSADAILGKVDGNTVTQWLDVSGNGYNADYNTAAPVYKTNIINGLPVVRFSDTTNTGMRINYLLGNTSGSAFTIVVVSKETVSAGRSLLSTRPVSGASQGWTFRYDSSTVINYFHLGSTGTTKTIVNQFNILSIRRNGLDITMGANGSEDLMTTLTGFTPNSTESFTQIGMEGNVANALDGDIAEIFIFTSDIGLSNLTNVVNHLKTKYAIT